ncbi:MAG: glutamate synthase subunit alpha, partial [Planctomycetes bacterium]|nr:glutamate synthase subunit alpha [Planctomycetota bacterium]
SYFKQLFAQVTNPPIDPLREELVMSLSTWAGPERNILDETPEHVARIRLDHPILSPADIRRLRQSTDPRVRVREIDMLFAAGDEDDAGPHGLRLEKRLDEMCAEAERLIATGVTFILLTDRRLDVEHAAVPSLLAVAALHHHLIRKSLRTKVSLIVESGDAREVMHIALLLGYGATAICPHVAISTIRSLTDGGRLENIKDHDDAIENYITALKKGLMKTMSRMGISTMRSYFAAQMFEAVGLSRALVERYFTGTSSMLSGIGIEGVAAEVIARHRRAFPPETSETEGRPAPLLDIGGLYQVRKGGEKHLWGADTIRLLQKAVREDDFAAFRQYTSIVDDQSRERATLR